MILETLGRLPFNIKSLALDEPQKRDFLPFDPERDISSNDWQNMKTTFEELRQGFNDSDEAHLFAHMGSSMKILFPEKANELILGDNEFSVLKGKLREIRRVSDPYTYSLHCMRVKILFPHRLSELSVTEDDWKWMEDDYHKQIEDSNWPEAVKIAANMVLFNPDKVTQAGLLNESLYDNLHREIQFPSSYFEAKLRILFPDKKVELKVTDWRYFNSRLELNRAQEEWWIMADLAADIKILAAQKVKVTDEGIEFAMPQSPTPFTQPIPGLPEVRRF